MHGIRSYITHTQNVEDDLTGAHRPAIEIVRQKLDQESGAIDPQKGEFYDALRYAWDAMVYDQYPIGSAAEHLAGTSLSQLYNARRRAGSASPEKVQLSEPTQVRMFAALTEAAGVPSEEGRTDVNIPKHLQDHYYRWVLSEEYQNRLKAAAARARGETGTEQITQASPNERKRDTSENRNSLEQQGFYTAFWDRVVQQSSMVPVAEDPAFWPRMVFEKFEFLTAGDPEFIQDRAKYEMAKKLKPIAESMRKIRTAYEIVAYPHIQKLPSETGKSYRQELIEDELTADRQIHNRDRVELTQIELGILQRLCETPRYHLGKDGRQTLQPKIPFDPQRRIYNYADIIGPAPTSPQPR